MSEPGHSSSLFELEGISAGYNGRSILHDLTLTIRAGESVALIGPNGCGKSTLFRVIAGLLQPSAGRVMLEGEDVTRVGADARIRRGIGYLKQTKNIFATLPVRENLALAGNSAESRKARMQMLIGIFPGLEGSLDRRAGLLSGGQRQALAVAMILMRPSRVLLLDEPVAGLSPASGAVVLGALKNLRLKEGFATVIVEHRLKQVQPHVDRVLVMREGRIVDDTTDTGRMLDASWLAGHYLNGKSA